MKNQYSTKPIDLQDIFDLVGTQSLTKEKKNTYILNLSTLAIKDFIYTLIPQIGSEHIADSLIQLVETKQSPDVIVEFLSKNIDDFDERFISHVRQYKTKLIKNYFAEQREELQKLLESADNDELKQKIFKKIQLFDEALSLVEKEQWDQLTKLWQ